MKDHDAHIDAPSQDGSHEPPTKHVHYEADAHSGTSDDDMREVEVCRLDKDAS
jgi:hypothetical protein